MPADEQRVRMRMRRLAGVQRLPLGRAMLLDAARLRQRQQVSERIDEHWRMAGLDAK